MKFLNLDKDQYVPVANDEIEPSNSSQLRPSFWQRHGSFVYTVAVHIALIYLLGYVFLSRRQESCSMLWPGELPFAENAVSFQEVTFDPSGFASVSGQAGSASPYEGPPTNETDELWHRLSDVGMYALTAEEYAQLDIETAPVEGSDGSEYIVTLEVFHQLHCVNYLRLRAYEKPGEPIHGHHHHESQQSRDMHLSHCIDYLRQVLMCHGDLTPITLRPQLDRKPPYMPNFDIKHTCRNFEQIWNFAKERNTTGVTIE